MEPIISPWLIYLAGIVNPLKASLSFVACVGFISWFVVGGYYYVCSPCDGCSEEYNRKQENKQRGLWKMLKVIVPITVASFILQAFLPDKETLIAMAVANIVTVDNIQGANEFVKTNVQDYINMLTDAINKVK